MESFPAPAKLNLMLRVTGRRSDGYHLLQTVFRFIDRADEVRIAVRADGAIVRKRPLPGVAEQDDLTLRAARALKTATGTPLGAEIEVVKHIPMGAGLGGGSSDAATVLLALNRLWNAGVTREALQALGLTLGADVPVFIYGETALGEGIGERLQALPLAPAWYLVLTPPVEVPTARVFAHPELKRDSKPIKIQGFSAGTSSIAAANDLETLVCRLYPEVARHLEWLRQYAPALMTGSGAAVFAAFDNEHAARDVFARLPPTMQGFVAGGLDRHPLYELAG
ncbi:MAG TPA: 4-(cytidine 5'-diphospho)-2-C-methyl-D-erythritol kinase [Burkholderiales bacterium]|nr:4-(cytidine 5'-diphospho)-2-C-methyl-D-erythritol kinase [Burkholderiales bacterium]